MIHKVTKKGNYYRESHFPNQQCQCCVHVSSRILCFLHPLAIDPIKHFPMDLSNQKKPSLPRLSTNVSLESQSTPLLPLQPKLQDTNARPKRERPVTLPSPFPGQEENDLPTVHSVPEPKSMYSTKGPEDAPVKKKSHYYEDAFTTRGSHNSPQDRIAQNSVVVAELKTNCKVCCLLSCP